jgi:NADH-quinone oxidoreductase subunit I
MAATVKSVERPRRTVWVQSYLPEVFRGLAVTSRQMVRNLFGSKDVVTIQYPEVKKRYPPRYRGLHRLMHRDDGQVRCVACMCCSTACPANCIHIVAAEHPDNGIEKYPAVFVIDELRCIVCGFCVEACPCDAIRMDSGVHTQPFEDRTLAFFDKAELMTRGTGSIALQGGKYKGEHDGH